MRARAANESIWAEEDKHGRKRRAVQIQQCQCPVSRKNHGKQLTKNLRNEMQTNGKGNSLECARASNDNGSGKGNNSSSSSSTTASKNTLRPPWVAVFLNINKKVARQPTHGHFVEFLAAFIFCAYRSAPF